MPPLLTRLLFLHHPHFAQHHPEDWLPFYFQCSLPLPISWENRSRCYCPSRNSEVLLRCYPLLPQGSYLIARYALSQPYAYSSYYSALTNPYQLRSCTWRALSSFLLWVSLAFSNLFWLWLICSAKQAFCRFQWLHFIYRNIAGRLVRSFWNLHWNS